MLLLIVLGGFLPRLVYAQQGQNVVYGGLMGQKWLPDFSIKDVIQDRNYNIWVATNAGLFKYNINDVTHYDITQYTSDKYLNNQIFSIAEDQNKNILIGTQSGLGLFNIEKNRISLISGRNQSITGITPAMEHKFLYIADKNNVYLLTPNSSGSDYRTTLIFRGSAYRKNLVKAVSELGKDYYAIGTSDGLWLLKDGRLHPTFIQGAVSVLYKQGDILWAGTTFQGIYKCLLGPEGIISGGHYIPGNSLGEAESIQEIAGFNNEKVLFATTNGIYTTSAATFPKVLPLKKEPLFDKNSIRKVLIDNTSNIWVGSQNGLFTLNRLSLHTQFFPFNDSRYQNVTMNDLLALDDDSLLIATNSMGLVLVDLKHNSVQRPSSGFRNVRLLRKSADGNLMILADNRFTKQRPEEIFSHRDTGWFLQQRGLNDVVEIRSGEFWFSQWRKKIIRLNTGAPDSKTDRLYRKIINSFPDDVHIYALEKDSRNNLWVGTRGDGLLRVNLSNNEVKKYERKDNFPDQITCIKEDSHNRLWVGTRDKGLLLYQPESGEFRTFGHRNGLPSNTISAIQENTLGELWFSTLNGIAKLNEGKVISFSAYNKESGIFDAEFSFNIAGSGTNGRVFFGTDNGVYELFRTPVEYPEAPLKWTNVDLIKGSAKSIEQMSTDAFSDQMLRDIEQSGTIVLEHNQNCIQIGFAKLDYTMPKQNLYLYRLSGYDTGWTILRGDNSKVQYFNLPQGEYVFQAMASTSDNVWDNSARSFVIVVKPSIWSTDVARIVYILIALLSVFFLLKMARRWKRLNRRLKEKIDSAKLYDQKMVYYADLSHEIKNRLTLILGPLEDALKNKKVNYQLLNRIYEQGQYLKRFSDQIMNIRRSESGDFLLAVGFEDIISLLSKIAEDSRPLAMIKGIQLTFTSAQSEIAGWCDAEILEIIVMNILDNAVKYCKSGGIVKMSLDLQYLEGINEAAATGEGNYLICNISDTGIGITEDEISEILSPFYRGRHGFDSKEIPGKGIGLDLVARLIKKHHGYLEIRSEPGDFTMVTFYLPIDRPVFSLDEIRPNVKTHSVIVADHGPDDVEPLFYPDDGFQEKESKVNSKKYKLLLVDDDYEMLFYLKDIFEGEFSLVSADSVKGAFEIVNDTEIDLIICDLDMPGENGLTLCKALKASPEFAEIPFILLTARNSEEQKLIAFKCGVDDFIDKPFSSELLSWRIKSILNGSLKKPIIKTVIVTEPTEAILKTTTEKFIQDVIDLIEKNIDKEYLNVDYLAEEMFMSRATFYRKMEEMFGETPNSFIKQYRLKKALLYIKNGNYSLKQISDRVGFSNPKYFSKCFKSEFGVLPSEYYTAEGEENNL